MLGGGTACSFFASSIHTVECCLPDMQGGLAAARGFANCPSTALNMWACMLGLQEQCQKLRDERETAMRDLARLRCDCEAGNAERDRLAAELADVKEELSK